MKHLIIGIGEYDATNTTDTVLKTFALGSCVAVILLHPPTRTIGMAHVAFPESKADPVRCKELPGYFVDTAIPVLIDRMNAVSGNAKAKGYRVKLAGGAKVMDPNGLFNIGNRNVLAVKKSLWKYGLGPVAEDIGGAISRTVAVHVNTGKIVISSPGRDNWNI
ncbi:MAG: chemotaxis protein CheD [Thermodesulfobacteriota bacterium]|nr:chemotaxis protein CheD [Thermodesulfobacteriota bacterium]